MSNQGVTHRTPHTTSGGLLPEGSALSALAEMTARCDIFCEMLRWSTVRNMLGRVSSITNLSTETLSS